jgi:2-deoxy-D-gluconate 3-dehydrogenase
LSGRVALVTGGSRGIGRAIGERLAAKGVRLAIMSRQPHASVSEMRERGIDALALPVDLRTDDPLPAVKRVLDHYGRLDILVYSAGMNIRKPLLELTLDEWRTIHRVNVEAAFLTAQACAPPMAVRTWGRMLFIASVASFRGVLSLTLTGYMASKTALLGLVRGLAKELASSGIRVNALAPGFTRTQLTVPTYGNPAFRAESTAHVPVGRWGEPEDMAEAGAFLCSEEADYITGQTLVVDGGFLVY